MDALLLTMWFAVLLAEVSPFTLPRTCCSFISPRSTSPRSTSPLSFSSTRLSAITDLRTLLNILSPLGPHRIILIPPGGSSILETTVDSWAVKGPTSTPSGKELLTAKSSDSNFELHIDVNAASSATLGLSPKTGGPRVSITDEGGSSLIMILPSKVHAAAFTALAEDEGGTVTFHS